MAHARSYDYDASRRQRLARREWRAAASVEREPPLLPATCPRCRVVLGLVEVGHALRCVDCGIWVEPDDDLTGAFAVNAGAVKTEVFA
jgi:hypothetical protein